MIIVINGPLIVKAEVAIALQQLIAQAALVDADMLRLLDPDAYANVSSLLVEMYAQGARHTILYIYETAAGFGGLLAELAKVDRPVHAFYLAADPDLEEQRIRARNYTDTEEEVSRVRELIAMQQADGALDGALGEVLASSGRSIEDMAGTIMGLLWSR